MATLDEQRALSGDLLIHSVTKLDADGEVPDAWVWVENGVIARVGIGDSWRELTTDAPVVDGKGRVLTPGFIDIHMHGGGGYSNEEGADAIEAAAASHGKHGTTRIVASFVANPVPVLLENLSAVADIADHNPSILGSHLEGPFLEPARKGAHNSAYFIDPDSGLIDDILAAARGTLRQITIDPSRPGALSAIETLSGAGVVVAIGHTEADYGLTREALSRGARLLTHTFNAMPGIEHRKPGPIVAALEDPEAFFELIFDNEHVDPQVASLLMRLAPGRVALITDAMAAACEGDGTYRLGDLTVVVRKGRAMLPGSTTLAGSTLTLDMALRFAVSAGIPRETAIDSLTLGPARILGIDSFFGRLKPGYAADVVLFDSDWTVATAYSSPSYAERRSF